MKFYLPRLITIFIAFTLGVCAVWLWFFEAKKPNLESVVIAEKPIIAPLVEATPQQIQSVTKPHIESKPKPIKPILIDQHENFEDVVLALKRLAAFTGKKGLQTFHISKVRYGEGEYAYAYWKQDNSIIILHFPFYGEPSDSQLYWLSGKARIDLKNVVPTGKYENLGCCLVEKDWADKVLSWCKAGYKLKFVAK